jgi:sugar phosphate isomerase/epimerase
MDPSSVGNLVDLCLQTWTIRRELRSNAANALARVSETGIHHLELGGTGSSTPASFGRICRERGFQVIGLHESSLNSDGLHTLLGEIKARCNIFGARFVTVWWGRDRSLSHDAYLRYADICSKAGKILRQDGIVLCYHCYAFDLRRLGKNHDDKSGMDILLESTDDEDLSFQLDTYFLYKAQRPAEQVLSKCGHRCRLIHVDDMDEKGLHAPLGAGSIPWPELTRLILERCSVEWFILEHESRTALRWVRKSADYWRETIVPIIREST